MDIRPVKFCDAVDEIPEGAIILDRSDDSIGNEIIEVAGRSPYVHARMVARWGSDLMSLEIKQGVGGRAVLLEREVRRWPGLLDVYAVRAPVSVRRVAVANMRKLMGCDYNRRSMAHAALSRIWFVRRWFPPEIQDDANGGDLADRETDCSEGVSLAYRLAGKDLVLRLGDRSTEPADLGRSPYLEYLFTLYPSSWEEQK